MRCKNGRLSSSFILPPSSLILTSRAAAAVSSYRRRRADRRREDLAGEPAGEAVPRNEDSRGRRQPVPGRVLQRQAWGRLPLPALLPALALRPAAVDLAARPLHRADPGG